MLYNVKNCLFCHRCRHFWKVQSLINFPKKCPKCTSPYWNKDLGSTKSQTDTYIAVDTDTKEIIGKGTIKALRYLTTLKYQGHYIINNRKNGKKVTYLNPQNGKICSIYFTKL